MSGARAAPPPDRAAAIRRVLLGLLVANLAVVTVKVVIGVKTGSLSVLGDAIHSSVDALNNIVFMVLMRLADSPPDADHPYGHGKFESLGALLILVFLSVTCFELLKTSLTGLLHGAVVPQIRGVHLALLASTLLINLVVTWYERRRGVALASDLLVADAAHTRVDVFISAGVLAGAVLMRFGVRYIDAAIAIIIVVLVVRVGWEIIRDAIPSLVDQVAREADAIRRNAEEIPGVRAAYAIRSRAAAGVVFAELTIGVDGTMSVGAAHDIADAVEARLKGNLQLDQVVVHIEPC
ncbi:MAG: cation diffusion facilitator family transporter [Gemmatimonadales bacterium]